MSIIDCWLILILRTNPTDSDSSTFLCSIADASVYPASIELHNKTVNMIANLWHAPKPPNGQDFTGAGTVGSTEGAFIVNFYYHTISHAMYSILWFYALSFIWIRTISACLLAGLALKFRWRKWYAKKHGLTDNEVLAVRPNLVISSAYQAST